MSAGMATKVQAKTYFPGSMMELNNGVSSGMWDLYNDGRSQGYDSYVMRQTMDGYPGYMKEQMRQTILSQESVFKQQIQELHRVYRRQRDLMNESGVKEQNSFTIPVGTPKPSHFLSQVSPRVFKEMNTQRIVIDLELPADVEADNERKPLDGNVRNLNKKRAYNLADLNEPIQIEETSFAASLVNKNSDHCFTNNGKSRCFDNGYGYGNGIFSHRSNLLQAEPKKAIEQLSRKRTLFGVELCENSHTPSFDSSQSSSWQINNSNSRLMTSSRAGLPYQNGCGILETSREKREKLNRLPSWLMEAKGKETTLYQMNLDSLQHHSQQFFKKAETSKVQIDLNAHDLNAENEGLVKENCKNNCITEMRHQIDLNLSFDEEEDSSSTPYIPEAVVKIASMEIDLEAPADVESETDDDKAAAEAIISISSFEPPQEPPAADTLLWWFAEVIASGDNVRKDSVNSVMKDSVNVNNNEECIPEGMDYFEYMTLKLQETKEEYECYKPVIMEEKEEDESLLKKRITRKGQGKRGRQRKDFQRDVLPGIVSLSRREVTEDIQTFEEAFTGIGISWQSKRKAGGKNGRGRRRLVVSATSSPSSPPPPPPVATAVEESVCRQVALEEKSLSGWGKRTRRLPRQRCQNGGNHHSLALKC